MPSNVSITGDDALTLDMVGQYTYCPRRFHLMYVEGRWDDNAYTIEGRHIHRRVDRVDRFLPEADAEKKSADDAVRAAAAGDEPPVVSRSVPLASSALGLSAKLDLASSDGDELIARIAVVESVDSLLGLEGNVARQYFKTSPRCSSRVTSTRIGISTRATAGHRKIRSTRCCRSRMRCWPRNAPSRCWLRGWTLTGVFTASRVMGGRRWRWT